MSDISRLVRRALDYYLCISCRTDGKLKSADSGIFLFTDFNNWSNLVFGSSSIYTRITCGIVPCQIKHLRRTGDFLSQFNRDRKPARIIRTLTHLINSPHSVLCRFYIRKIVSRRSLMPRECDKLIRNGSNDLRKDVTNRCQNALSTFLNLFLYFIMMNMSVFILL